MSSTVLILSLVVVVVAIVVIFFALRRNKDGSNSNPGNGGGPTLPTDDEPVVYPLDQRPIPNGIDPLADLDEDAVLPIASAVVYVENWSSYRPQKQLLDLSRTPITHSNIAIYSFFGISDEGKVLFSDQWADFSKNQFKGFITQCNQNGITPGMSIGGYTYSGTSNDIKSHRFSESFEVDTGYFKKLTGAETFDKIINNATAKATFIASIGEFVTKFGLGVIDIDYEYPNCPGGTCSDKWNQRDGFTALITELCSTYPNVSFSIAISPNSNTLRVGTDLASLNQISNLSFNIMSYDYHVYDPDKVNDSTGHNQTLLPGHSAYPNFNVKSTLEYISKQDYYVGAKYRIGMAAYGRVFPVTDEQLEAAVSTGNFSYLNYPKKVMPQYVFPASQQQGVVFYNELDDLGDVNVTTVLGDGSWIARDDGAIISVSSLYTFRAIRHMALQYGINDVVIWTAGQAYQSDIGDPFELLQFMKLAPSLNQIAGRSSRLAKFLGAPVKKDDEDNNNNDDDDEAASSSSKPAKESVIRRKRRHPLRPNSLLKL